jgi:hypothetical protein
MYESQWDIELVPALKAQARHDFMAGYDAARMEKHD